MNISGFLLAVWFILIGATWLGWVTIDMRFLGLLGFITGILLLIDSLHPLVIRRP